MSLVNRLKSEFFPKAVLEGKFGDCNLKFLDYKSDDSSIVGDHNCSVIYFGEVILETIQGDQSAQSIVIKARDTAGSATGGRMAPWLRLSNEYLFYTEILPLLQKCDSSGSISEMFPKFIFGRLASSDDDTSEEFLIFENVRKRGFKLCPSRIFIDFDHLELIFRRIAQFHALSFVCKKRYPREFEEITSKLRELIYTKEELVELESMLRANTQKSVSTLLQQKPEYGEKVFNVSQVFENAGLSMSKVAAPKGPLSVLCHSDLQRNNIFFRYNSERGAPVELTFFDLALMRHASPAIDLSMPLFANALPETRSSKWTQLLRIYHSTLTSCPDLDAQMAPSFDDLILDFRRRAFHGYTWGCVSLTVMLAKVNEPEVKKDGQIVVSKTEEECGLSIDKSGERGAFYLKENVKFTIDENFDFQYILNLNLDS